MTTDDAARREGEAPFPRVFRVALVLEVFERLAFYGVYVNLAVYLLDTIHFTEVEMGSLLGAFAFARAMLPLATGALVDRLGFRASLVVSFSLYALAYAWLFAAPSKTGAWSSVLAMAGCCAPTCRAARWRSCCGRSR